MEKRRAKTLILGIGNILLSDEGIGVRVIEHLQKQRLPDDIDVVDGGTAGADLIDILAGRDTVVIVDAVQSDRPAGTILRLGPDDLSPHHDNPLSLHDLDIPQTLMMTKMLNCAPKNVIIFGVVPECVAAGMELSQTLAQLVPTVADMVLEAAAMR